MQIYCLTYLMQLPAPLCVNQKSAEPAIITYCSRIYIGRVPANQICSQLCYGLPSSIQSSPPQLLLSSDDFFGSNHILSVLCLSAQKVSQLLPIIVARNTNLVSFYVYTFLYDASGMRISVLTSGKGNCLKYQYPSPSYFPISYFPMV